MLYSALGSFYIPSCIMVFVYIRIYFAAKARARRGIKKPPRRPPQDAVTSFSTAPGETKNGAEVPASGSLDRNSNTSPRDGERQIATIEAHPQPMIIPTVTCDLASDISTSDAGEIPAEVLEQKDTLKVSFNFNFSHFLSASTVFTMSCSTVEQIYSKSSISFSLFFFVFFPKRSIN